MIIEVTATDYDVLLRAFKTAEKSVNLGIATEIILNPGVYRHPLPGLEFNEKGRVTPLKISGFRGKDSETIITGLSPLPREGWDDLGNGLFSIKYSNSFGTHGDPWFPVKDRVGRRCEQLFVDGVPYIPRSVEKWETSGFWNVETPENERGKISESYAGYRFPDRVLEYGEFSISEGPDLGPCLFVRFKDGDNPESSDMEITSRQTLLSLGSKDNFTLESLTFTGAGTFPEMGKFSGVILNGPCRNLTLSNCHFLWNSAFGLSLENVSNLNIKSCTFNFNGYGGLGMDSIKDFSIENCQFNGNDWRNYLAGDIKNSHCTAGVKIHKALNGSISHSKAIGNGINGIWLDVQCEGIVVNDCLCMENHREGLFFEFSNGPFKALNNILMKNGEHDYLVDSVGVTFAEGNEIYHTGSGEAVSVGQGMRYNKHTGKTQIPGQKHVIKGNNISLTKEKDIALALYNRMYSYQATDEDTAAYERFPACLEISGNRFHSSFRSVVVYEDVRKGTRKEFIYPGEPDLKGLWRNNLADTEVTVPHKEEKTEDEGWQFWSLLKEKAIYE